MVLHTERSLVQAIAVVVAGVQLELGDHVLQVIPASANTKHGGI
jgi:hypothetical protein